MEIKDRLDIVEHQLKGLQKQMQNSDLSTYVEFVRYAKIVTKLNNERKYLMTLLKHNSEELPSFLYKSEGGLYFKHTANTDITSQWNEYLKNRQFKLAD